MKYIRKDRYLLNIEKCVHIRVLQYTDGRFAIVFQNENGDVYLTYENDESVDKDMERIGEFILNEERLLKL